MAGNNKNGTEIPEDGPTQKEKPHPVLSANVFSRITFWWMGSLFYTAYKRPLNDTDCYDPLPSLSCEKNVTSFEKRWYKLSKKERQKRGALFVNLLLHNKIKLIQGLMMEFFSEIIRYSTPFLITGLVQFLNGSGQISKTTAYIYTAILLVIIMLMSLLNCHAFFCYHKCAMELRTLCAGLIYKKVLTISNRARRQTSAGNIVTHMSTDIEVFHMCMTSFHASLFTPFILVAFLIFGAFTTGYAVITGFAAILLFLFWQLFIGKLIGRLRYSQETWTRQRVHLMSEIITAMKVIKMYCWEKPFAKKAKELRRSETDQNLKRLLLVMTALLGSLSIGIIVVYVVLLTSYLIGDKIEPMTTILFIGWIQNMQVFVFIHAPLAIGNIYETLGATQRIQGLLNSEDFIQDPLVAINSSSEALVKFTAADANWEPNHKEEREEGSLTLKDVNLLIESETLVGITGKVGSGKTSLLMAILGELQLLHGERNVCGSLAYVSQEPWILSDTVRKNIILDLEFDQARYDSVLEACTLDVDIKGFNLGDLTLVGERGLSLSGGQKSRLNLARAVYQNADIYLFDDPLAAVDDKVGRHIFNECICGLLKSKLRILVTHNLHYLPLVDNVMVMNKGEIVLEGKFQEISDRLLHYVDTSNMEDHENAIATDETSKAISPVKEKTEEAHTGPTKEAGNTKEGDASNSKVRLKEKESGKVSIQTYWKYFDAGNGKIFSVLIIISLCLYKISELGGSWTMSQWYSERNHTDRNDTTSTSPLSEYDDRWFSITVGSLVLGTLLFAELAAGLMSMFIAIAGRRLYDRMFKFVLGTPLYFFETNPVGQVLNRFARDTGFMDINLSIPLTHSIVIIFGLIAFTIYSCVIFPWMILGALLAGAAVFCFMYFSINCVRDLRRLEGSFRSPTYSHLSTTLQGIQVIRALRKQSYFLSQAYTHIDRHASAWHLYLQSARFVGIRIDFLSFLLSGGYIVVTVIMNPSGMQDAASSGLAMIYMLAFIGALQYASVQLVALEANMTSVERILQFSHLEQEAPAHTDVKPPPGWPTKGAIELTDMCLTYRGQNKPALGPLTINILPAEKVGIVGRTGAGKSSVFVSLLRMVEPTGSISIDGIEVTKMGLNDLRGNISIIPQDPVLFTGSLRMNLDPFEEFDDEKLWSALNQVALMEKVSSLPGGLSAEVGEAGDNFSVGEKQLLCMARALMRRNKIIIVDEATANVDNRTDRIIQATLQTEFSNSTVLTIAHRINTIITYDKIMVLDNGHLVEFDHPYKLLQNSEGVFYQKVVQLGADVLTLFTELALKSSSSPRRHCHENGCEQAQLSLNEGSTNLAFSSSDE